MFKQVRFIPAALAAAALFAVSASAMAQVPSTAYSKVDAQPAAVAQVSTADHAVHSAAWAFSADGRNQPIH